MDDFLKLNEGVIDPYLERIYENFEVTSYDFKNGNPTIILDGNSDTMFSCFSCGEGYEDQIPLDRVTYHLLDEARDGLPEDIRHPLNNGFIYVNAVAESMGMDCVEWQMGDTDNNDKIQQQLYQKYRHKVPRKGLEELFKELGSVAQYAFKEFLVAKGLVE